MSIQLRRRSAAYGSALVLLTLNLPCSTLFAQGSLAPPGAPAPTMRTLDQIEPRTPISSLPITITNSGSYYLTTNLHVSGGDAITITTNSVTLDLKGFTISSTSASATGTGVLLSGNLTHIQICNGCILSGVTNNGAGGYSGSGFENGINDSSGSPVVSVSRVSVFGCLNYGIFLGVGDSTVAESCSVRTVGTYGISASTVRNSVAMDCGSDAIDGYVVTDCRGEASDSGSGISGQTVLNCYGRSKSGYGVTAANVQNCEGYSTAGIGISADTAQNCYGYSSGTGKGVSADTAQNCEGYSESGFGVYAFETALACYGSSSTGTGLYARNASFCTARRPSGTAIQATMATGCYASSGTNIIVYKYNMP